MSLEEQLAGAVPPNGSLVTIGVFDGVHLGHQRLLGELASDARKKGLSSIVVTFKRHPQRFLRPESATPFLTSLVQKIALIRELGVDTIIPLNFNGELAQIGYKEFVGTLKKCFKMRGLVVGPDFALGRDRLGNIEALRRLVEEMDFTLSVVPPVMMNGEPVSSTAIRNALMEGDIDRANAMLGRPFSVTGCVIRGSGRGEKLGFPTANLDIDPLQALPQDGVYASISSFEAQTLPSITYIGPRPTFGETERTVEAYIFGYKGNLYRKNIKIDIIKRLRGDIKFTSQDKLIEQIKKDIAEASNLLNRRER